MTSDAGQILKLLNARLRTYESECGHFTPPKSSDDTKNLLWASIEQPIPCSIFLVLLALRWCLEHATEVDEAFLFDLIVEDIINVSETWWVPYSSDDVPYEKSVQEGERFRQWKEKDFDKWPTEDCVVVHEWLSHFAMLPFVQRKYSEQFKKTLPYWKKRAGNAS